MVQRYTYTHTLVDCRNVDGKIAFKSIVVRRKIFLCATAKNGFMCYLYFCHFFFFLYEALCLHQNYVCLCVLHVHFTDFRQQKRICIKLHFFRIIFTYSAQFLLCKNNIEMNKIKISI